MRLTMKEHLFYTFLGFFALTGIVTLLGIVGVLTIPDFYLKALFSASVLQLIGAVVAIFKGARFFQENGSPRSYIVRLVIQQDQKNPVQIQPGQSVTYVLSPKDQSQRRVRLQCPVLVDSGPYISIREVPENTDHAFIMVGLDDKIYSGSFSLQTQVVNMVQSNSSALAGYVEA